jgi:hypothetical protein
MSTSDSIIRFIVVIVLLSIFFIGNVRGVMGVLILLASMLFLFTSLTRFCPFYKSIDTYPFQDKD